MFLKQVYEKEDQVYQTVGKDNLEEMLKDGLTPYQRSLLERVRKCNTEPIIKYPRASQRSKAAQEASIEIHKRVNPGYVDIPYQSTNELAFKYLPAPGFSKAFLKKKSDCDFQGFANTAILLHVDLNKTSH